MDTRNCRSFLFVPGDRPDRFAKALSANADAVVIDLEDAVGSDQKDAARNAVASWLSAEREVVLRINAVDTPWFTDDLTVCSRPGVAAVMVPKAERVEDLRSIGECCELLPLIETAAGLDNVKGLARVANVQRVVFGSIDLQLDLGMDGGHEELVAFRTQLVMASRLADIAPPIDGVTVVLDDLEQVREDAIRARRLGFGGKLCIHPSQVATVNDAFTPSEDEVAWARRVVAAAGASQGAAVAVDGRMVDKPVLMRAQRILREARSL